jgi:D-sedoheptulose 7-phosphate isomerase
LLGTVYDAVKLLKKDRFIYIAGNGGSASTASHLANDLMSRGYKAISLCDSTSNITRIGNDRGYDYIFSDQLKVLFEEGDVLIVISASGNSTNLINAVNYASSIGYTISIVGFDGGKLMDMCDVSMLTPTKVGMYEYAEDMHLKVCHVIAKLLGNKL